MNKMLISVITILIFLFFISCFTKKNNGNKTEKSLSATSKSLPRKELNYVDKRYYTYTGFRDWWRFPLEFPYQMIMIDTFDNGKLEKYIGGDVRDPNESSELVFPNIEAVIMLDGKLIFRSIKKEYGVFEYKNGKITLFKTEKALYNYLDKRLDFKFISLEKAYDDFLRKAKKQ